MDSLTSLPVAALFGLALFISFIFAAALNVVLHFFVPPDLREASAGTAAAYMTALGSLFAILTGFLINSEYGTLRQAQNLVGSEVAAASRLAYATEGLPAADTEVVQAALLRYLDALDHDEWRSLAQNNANQSTAFPALKDLQKAIFNIGSNTYAPDGSVTGMQDAVAELTGIRAVRIAIASQSLPTALFGLSIVAGLFLIANALTVTLRSGFGYTLVSLGIVVVVALDLAAVLAVSGPYRGPFQASRGPLQNLDAELRTGQYLPWIERRDQRFVELAEDSCEVDPRDCLTIGVGEPIDLGALLWLDPTSCCVGIDSLTGLRMAIDYLDGSFDGVDGQLLGHDIVVLVENEGCDAAQGIEGAKRFAENPTLLATIGTSCSAAALDAADHVLSEAGILMISPSNTAPSLTDPARHERYYFRTAYNDKIQGAVVADFAFNSLRTTRAVTIDDGSGYSAELARAFSQRFGLAGGTLIEQEGVAPGQPLAPLIEAIAAEAPDVIFLPLYEPTCHETVLALRANPALRNTSLIVSESCQQPSFLAAVGPGVTNVYSSGPDFAAMATEPFYSQAFLPAYEARYGQAPGSVFHAHAFDAANLLFGALRRTAEPLPGGGFTVRRSDLRAALLSVQGYPGVSGVIDCRPSGDCARGARIAIYQAPAWPVTGGLPNPRPLFGQNKLLTEVE